MPPDLNTLPPSRSPTNPRSPLLTASRRTSTTQAHSPENNPPSPRSPLPTSLHATAAMNAVHQRSSDAGRAAVTPEQRRLSYITAGSLQESAAISPIEFNASDSPQYPQSSHPQSPLMHTADPHHQRAPSLGQIHQQLENEQEAQVNRLLQMIRVQQDQISVLQSDQSPEVAVQPQNPAPPSAADGAVVPEDSRASMVAHTQSSSMTTPQSIARSPLQTPAAMSRQSSRGGLIPNSLTSSPSLRPLSSTRSHDDWSMSGTRDDSSFYQAETQMLQRENQMLRMRIRELEKQVSDLNWPQAEAERQSSQQPGT